MPESYTDIQKSSFGNLVDSGTYNKSFQHAPAARAFFADVISQVLNRFQSASELSILDCGCGTGAWLGEIHELSQGAGAINLYGFDLTPEMVSVAREKFSNVVPSSQFQPGNILEGSSFSFPGEVNKFDIVFCYDVIQQLPKKLQYQAITEMLQHIKPNGVAVVFDNDSNSAFGRKMGAKKFITSKLGIPLVPRYYCNASYPPLERFKQRLIASEPVNGKIIVSSLRMKRALVLELR